MTASPTGPLRLRTLGAFAVEDGAQRVLLGPGKPLALLVYLHALPGRSASRNALVDLLWSDLDSDRGRQSLRQALSTLRGKLGLELVADGVDAVRLATEIHSDRERFLAAVGAGRWDEAVEEYGGSFITRFAAPGSATFEQWADLERARLEAAFVMAAETAVSDRLDAGQAREARALALRVRDRDPYREAGWRMLIRALLALGDRTEAEMACRELEVRLAAQGAEPEPSTQALLDRVRALPPPVTGATDSTLSAELVGREREFALLVRAWRSAREGRARRIHIRARAGLGKTRLLHDLEARLRDHRAAVVSVRAHRAERSALHALAGDLAAALGALPGARGVPPGAASVLVGLAPGLSSIFSTRPDEVDGEEAIRRRTMALCELIASVAYEQPVAILIDDVHRADAASRRILAGVVDRLGAQRVLLVTAGRPGPAETGTVELVELRALSRADTEALFASLAIVPSTWGTAAVDALHRSSEGSPLLILETLRLAMEASLLAREEGTWRTPDEAALLAAFSRQDAVASRLQSLGMRERTALSLLAVAPTGLTEPQVAAAAGWPEEVAADTLGDLERRGAAMLGVGGAWRPAHDEIGELLLASIPAVDAQMAALQVGRALAADPTLPHGRLAEAARLLQDGGDEQGVVLLLRRWVEAMRALGDRRAPEVLARDFLGEGAAPERVAALARTVPLGGPGRLAFARRALLVAGGALLLVAVVALVARAPHALVVVGQPRVAAGLFVPAPVVEVRDWLGRPVAGARGRVHVRVDGAMATLGGDTVVSLADGRATFGSTTFVPGVDAGPARLRFESPGLTAAVSAPIELEGAPAAQRLVLERGTLNARPVSGEHPVLQVRQREQVRGEVWLRYATNWVSRPVRLVARASWPLRGDSLLVNVGVPSPAEEQRRVVSVTFEAPHTPGRHLIRFELGGLPNGAESPSASLMLEVTGTQ